MLDEKNLIKRNQRKQYQNNEQTTYEVKIPSTIEGLIHFNPGTYIVTLPKETKPCTLSFESSVVYLKGNKKGSLKPLNNIELLCECCIVDLTNGPYGIPTNIKAKSIILKDANYTRKITDMYTVDQEDELYRTVIQSLFSTSNTLSIRDSYINLGPLPLTIDCHNLHLSDAQIILPYNCARISCNTLELKNSNIDVQGEKLTLYSEIATLTDSIISGEKSEVEIGETLLKGNSKINIETTQKSIK